MSEILVWKGKLQKIYARYSIYIDKALQFLVGFLTFFLINKNIGMMKALNSSLVVFALSAICTFLPPVCTALAGAVLVIAHLLKLSMGVAAVAAAIFVVMYIFYCRFTPQKAIIILLTALAFGIKIPYVVPILCGLAASPIAAIPAVFGAVAYFMISYVKTSSAAIDGAEGMAGQVSLFVKSVFQNKEMWITIMAFVICILAVYCIRRLSVDYSWMIAIIAGAVINIVAVAAGDVLFDVKTSYSMLFLGNIAAVAAGAVLEVFLFAVDYARTEYLQYEDDEYYYYVKAVPKVSVTVPKTVVKRINERRDTGRLEQGEPGRRQPRKNEMRRPGKKQDSQGRRQIESRENVPRAKKAIAAGSASDSSAVKKDMNTEELLLAKSLQEELDIQNIVEKELEGK